jgi:3-oxoacyl-[acyl-carrier protein] reductase
LTKPKEEVDSIEMHGEKVAVGIPEAQRRMMEAMIPLGRVGTTEEAASAILFFASPLSNYVSGQTLKVSGGLSL